MFFEQVKALCNSRHIAITSLARQLHLSPSAPNNWQNGTLPKAETIMKISDFFDVSTDFLLYGKDRSSNVSSNVSNGAAVFQQSKGNTVTISSSTGSGDLQGFEAELLRIYRELDMKGKMDLMQYAFGAEERAKGGENL